MRGVRIVPITLRAARVNKGLTQEEAVKMLGITAQTLLNNEKGKRFPDVKILKTSKRFMVWNIKTYYFQLKIPFNSNHAFVYVLKVNRLLLKTH